MPVIKYPVPVHMECKSSSGKLSPMQLKEKARIEQSGSIFLVVRRPYEFYHFIRSAGFEKLHMEWGYMDNIRAYREAEVVQFVRSVLKWLEKIYGVYWVYNMQNIGSNKGRPDFYFELPREIHERTQFQELSFGNRRA